jgi:glutaredoxin
MEEFVTLFPSAKTFPQIVVDGIHVGGYADFQEVMEMASE